MTDAIQAPRPGPDDTNAPDEQKKIHRAETKTRTTVEAKREGPTLEVIKADERVKVFIRSANQQTGAIGYTEHGERHANTSADGARFILKSLGHDARRCEVAAVAAYLHDMGNVVTREKHAQTGALLAKDILLDLGFPLDEVATVMGAVANHEEAEGGLPVSAVSAAVIIADKSDVHRSRVRNPKSTSFDIHDRVNYAVTASEIKVSRKEKLITLELADTALREVEEETGLKVRILAPIGTTDYWFAAPGERVHKFVHFFLMEPTGGDVSRHDHEYDEVRWVPADEARRLLSFDTYRDILDRALAAASEAA